MSLFYYKPKSISELFNTISIPRTQFRSSHELMTYDEIIYLNQGKGFGYRLKHSIATARAKKCGKYEFSINAKKRFKRAVNNLSLLCPKQWKNIPGKKGMMTHEASMLTFTIPQDELVDGKEAMKVLWLPFLKWVTRYAKTSKQHPGIRNYVWKIEMQEENRDQLHWHLITNDMISILQVQRKWNRLLSAGGYMGGHLNPPSFNVKSFTANDLAGYLSKELAKQQQNPIGLTCVTWGCSEGLEEPYFTVDMKEEHHQKLKKLFDNGKCSCKSGERWTFHWLKKNVIAQEVILTKEELEQFEERIRIIGGVVVRPKPIVIEVITEKHWFDLLQEEISVELETRPPPCIQGDLFDIINN